MFPPMKPYVVKQGDHLTKIALSFGIDPEETWNHPRNAQLRARREPKLLAPGDILYVPMSRRQGLSFTEGATNRYRGTVPPVPRRITFQAAGKPIADEPFQVRGLGWPLNGTSDRLGLVHIGASMGDRIDAACHHCLSRYVVKTRSRRKPLGRRWFPMKRR
jgi:LysM domain